MKIESKRRNGLTVLIPDDEYGILLALHGQSGAYAYVLNQAGRVLKHRRELSVIYHQVLSDDEKTQVECIARSVAVQAAIDAKIREMGYGNYLSRRDQGGMMPESFTRIVNRAYNVAHESITVTEDDRSVAMSLLGFYTDFDRQWSERVVSGCKWEITAPDGWGENLFTRTKE